MINTERYIINPVSLLYFYTRFVKITLLMEVESIDSLKEIWEGFDFTYLLSILLGVVPALVCITLHELSHGYTAYLLGDDTAKSQGRLTLNPLKHLDFMGLLMMVVFHVGWAKPVPVNMFKFKNPKRDMAVTALAGPVSNILISIVFLFLFGALYVPLSSFAAGAYILQMLELTAEISLGLAIFNFLPVPPLDGSKVLFSCLSNENYYKLMHYERYGMIIMFILVATGILGRPLSWLINTVYGWLFPVAQFACDIVVKLFYI